MDIYNFDIKSTIIAIVSAVFGVFFGDWDLALQTLIIFMAVDYITGIIVAGVYKKSNKSKDGSLSSTAGYIGLVKKGMILLIVLVAYRLDLINGTNIIRNTVIMAFIANEVISINENAVLMGIDIPTYLKEILSNFKK